MNDHLFCLYLTGEDTGRFSLLQVVLDVYPLTLFAQKFSLVRIVQATAKTNISKTPGSGNSYSTFFVFFNSLEKV
jgi:hypothetical protein